MQCRTRNETSPKLQICTHQWYWHPNQVTTLNIFLQCPQIHDSYDSQQITLLQVNTTQKFCFCWIIFSLTIVIPREVFQNERRRVALWILVIFQWLVPLILFTQRYLVPGSSKTWHMHICWALRASDDKGNESHLDICIENSSRADVHKFLASEDQTRV